MKPFEVSKYLRKGSTGTVLPAPLPSSCRDFMVIPACDESTQIQTALDSLAALDGIENTAVIFVVNHPENASPRVIDDNRILCRILEKTPFFRIETPPLKYGVGEARKIGFDTVIAALAPEVLEDTILYSFDADCTVEKNYFQAVRNTFSAETGAVSIGVHHQPGGTPDAEKAIREYERYMKNYVDRLRQAGSPYAFHTIGSAFAVRADVYVRSGGMRQKQAGEDFYFLQAVAKSFPVKELPEKLVHPSGRISQRVPFGTGRAVENLLNGGALPEIPNEPFAVLKQLLEHAHSGNPDFFAELPQEAKQFLEMNQFQKNWNNIVKNTPQNQLPAAFDRWFDGLQTLRFLHFLQEKTNDPS